MSEHFDSTQVLLQMLGASSYIWGVYLLFTDEPPTDPKPVPTSQPEPQDLEERERQEEERRQEEEKSALHRMIVAHVAALLYAFAFSSAYPPLVLYPALAAVAYAIEHLSSLGATEKRLESTRKELERSSGETQTRLSRASIDIESLVNRLGTKDWSVKFVEALKRGTPILSVVNVWDTYPQMADFLTSSQTLPAFASHGESFYHFLECRFHTAPTVKTTFIARAAVDSEHWLLSTCVPDDLNLLACLWQVTQIVQFNIKATQVSRLATRVMESGMINGKFDLEAAKKMWLDSSSQSHLLNGLTNEVSGSDVVDMMSRIEARLASVSEWHRGSDQGPPGGQADFGTYTRNNGKRLCVAWKAPVNSGRTDARIDVLSTNAYHVYIRINSTMPSLSLMGSPKAPIRRMSPCRKTGRGALTVDTLESAFAVAIVAGQQDQMEKKAYTTQDTKFDTTDLQNASKDYAFDLLVSKINPAFDEPDRDYESEEEALPARITVRAIDRLQKSELAHSVPLELYLIGRMMFRHAQSGVKDLESSLCEALFANLLAQDEIHGGQVKKVLRGFIEGQAQTGRNKNKLPEGWCPDLDSIEPAGYLWWKQL